MYHYPAASGSNMESLREELLRAEADRYTAKTFLEVARQEKVYMIENSDITAKGSDLGCIT